MEGVMDESTERTELGAPGRREDADEEPRRGREGEEGEGGVLTLVCFTCGTEYYFAAEQPPGSMRCEKCRSTVFRSFHSAGAEDEAVLDFRETTERDLDPDDAEGDVMPGDVLDLNAD
jgi:hypothetical protein